MAKIIQQTFSWISAIFTLILLLILGFFMVILISVFIGVDIEDLDGNVAKIAIDGVIIGSDDDFLFDSTSNSPDIIKLIEKANDAEEIKAIIFEINSPGGSAVASEEIANAIKKVNKTTVAWIREVGASGGYWIASSTDHIVASRSSITGSIGVIASYIEFPGFLERYNLTHRRLVSGKYKDIGSPLREMTTSEQAIFQKNLDRIRDFFVEEVAENRNMAKSEVDKVANGLFYLGIEAKDLGLVDELGSRDEVIQYISEKEDIEVDVVDYKEDEGFFDLISASFSKAFYAMGKGIGSSVFSSENNHVVWT